MKKRLEKTFPELRNDEAKAKELAMLVLECVEKKDHLNTFDIDSQESARSMRSTILQAILKGTTSHWFTHFT